MRVHLGDHQRVVGGIDHDRDAVVVLGPGADHGRSADVDGLDAGGEIRAARHGLLQRIEIGGQQVDHRVDRMIGERLEIRLNLREEGERTMDLRMQRLDPPIHHLRQAGDLGDVDHLDAGFAQQLGRTAGRNNVDAVPAQVAGKIDQAGLVADGKQRAGNLAGRHAVRLRQARLRWDRPDVPPPPPSVTRSMFQTIRTSLASPIMPPSTTCEVACGPRASARKKLSSILVSGALELIFQVSPFFSLSRALCPSSPVFHAHGGMQMEADGIFAGDQPVRALQPARRRQLVLARDQQPVRRHQELPRVAHAEIGLVALMRALDAQIVALIGKGGLRIRAGRSGANAAAMRLPLAPVAVNSADDVPSKLSVECAGVERANGIQSAWSIEGVPQLTMIGRLPELISKER